MRHRASRAPGAWLLAAAGLCLLVGCGHPKQPSHPGHPGDRDGDGIADERDQCPEMPEDHDGDQDDDGCPE